MDPAAVAAEPLPSLHGFPFLHAGAGVLMSGPTGGGRSSLVQACGYDAARRGVPVAYLSAKQDRADLTFSCKLKAQPVGLIITAHKIRTVRAPFRAVATRGFSTARPSASRRSDTHRRQVDEPVEFRPTYPTWSVYPARSRQSPGLTRRALRGVVTGRHDMKSSHSNCSSTEGYVEQRQAGAWPTHHSTAPFRADNEWPHWPQTAPGASGATLAPLAPTLKGQGPGATPVETTRTAQRTPSTRAVSNASSPTTPTSPASREHYSLPSAVAGPVASPHRRRARRPLAGLDGAGLPPHPRGRAAGRADRPLLPLQRGRGRRVRSRRRSDGGCLRALRLASARR